MKRNVRIFFSVIGIILISVVLIFNFNKDSKTIENEIKENKNITEKKKENNKEIKDTVKSATIISVGDIMFHDTQLIAAYDKESRKYDFSNVFEYVKKYIKDADIAIGNFETVTAGKEHGFRGYPRFNSPIETLIALKNTGFDILTTANNHSFDMGKEGVIETIENIEKIGLKSVGTYKDKNKTYLIKDINGIKIGFLSYTYGVNGYRNIKDREDLKYLIDLIDEDVIKKDISNIENLGSDLVVVFMHWGLEYNRKPSEYQKELANKMFDWGADIILGSHPHVIQQSETLIINDETKFIIYSMGNFISNQRRETLRNNNKIFTEDGVMIKIHIEKINSKTKISNIEYIPTWVNREKVNDKYKYEIIPINNIFDSIKFFDDDIKEKLKTSYINTMSIMDRKLSIVK